MSTTKNQNNKNSYFLRTQSTILKGEHLIPFNSHFSRSKSKKHSLSKSKTKTPKKYISNFTTGNKSIKTKKYINPKKEKNFFTNSLNSEMLDLNKVSRSSHFSNYLKSQKDQRNQNIIPNETNRFSLDGKEEGGINNNLKKNNINNDYHRYLTNNKNQLEKNSKLNKKNIYNSQLYTPFYDLIENVNKNTNKNKNEKLNNTTNNNFLNSNHIIEINNKNNSNNNINNNDNNIINDYNKNPEKKINLFKENKKAVTNKLNIKEKTPSKEILMNINCNKNSKFPLKIQTNDYLNYPKEEFKESIMAKTLELLNNNNNNKYDTQNINYDYTLNNQNNINTLCNKENNNNNYNYNNEYKNDSLKISFNKYPNNITYQYDRPKNKNNIEYIDKNKINLMINKLNYTINNLNKNNKNEIFENNINNNNNINNLNSNIIINSTINNYNKNSNNSLNRNSSYYLNEACSGRSVKTNLDSKYFLKTVFDQNLTYKFVNDFNTFSPLKQKRKNIFFSKFDFNNNNEKEKDVRQTPRNFYNIQKSENNLEQMLKTIPTHKKDKEKNNKKFEIYTLTQNKSRKKTFEEINSIMPPNILEMDNNKN